MFSISSIAGNPFLLAEVTEKASGGPPSLVTHLLAVIVFSAVGLLVLGSCFWLIKKLMPFSVTKEIEQDQNVALAIVLAAVILGMSMIISAAIL